MLAAFPKPVREPKAPRRLIRRTRVKAKRATPRRRPLQVVDLAYRRHIEAQPCELLGHGPCVGDVVAHHATEGRGKGQKSDDRTAAPLCCGHHGQFHDLTGFFRDFKRDDLRAWMAAVGLKHRARYIAAPPAQAVVR